MARPKKNIEDADGAGTDNSIASVFDSLDKLNPFSTMLSENTLSTVDTWIDTGCLALNAIISGDIYKGIPGSRITLFSGESQSGKTLIINKILASAQKNGMFPVMFDSEFDKTAESARRAGLDPTKVKYVGAESIEKTTVQMASFLDSVIKRKLQGKFIIALDSLGNLPSDKELSDAAKEEAIADMGLRAKAIKSFFRIMTAKSAIARVPIIIAMHIYADPAARFKAAIEHMSGGKAPLYMSSVSVQLTAHKSVKDSRIEDFLPCGANYSGVTLDMFTIKNRFIPPFLKVSNYLSFTEGLDKYSGLLDLAFGNDIITKQGNTYFFEGEKLGVETAWFNDESIWLRILPKLNVKLQEIYHYHNCDCAVGVVEPTTESDDVVLLQENDVGAQIN